MATTCEARCKSLTADIHKDQPTLAACGKPTVAECLGCIDDKFAFGNCGTPGCKAVVTCVETCSSTKCVVRCVNASAIPDGQAFVAQYGGGRLDAICNGSSSTCYAHCAGIAAFYCPAFGRTPLAP
jgi:hypothetical protein